MFRKLWKKVKSVFKKKKKYSTPAKPIKVNKLAKLDIKKVGVVRGHNRGAQGATNFLGQSEWGWHGLVMRNIAAHLYELSCVCIDRLSGASYSKQCRDAASRLAKANVDIAVCLHFNAGGGEGTEALLSHDNLKDQEDMNLALSVVNEINKEYGFKLRSYDGVKECKAGHNGFTMMHEINKRGIPCIIVEPCFGDNRNSKTEAFFKDPNKYAQVLARAIKKLNKNTP